VVFPRRDVHSGPRSDSFEAHVVPPVHDSSAGWLAVPPALACPAMIRVTFLGTSGARPTVRRNVSGLFLQREGESLLFDCGEGTQRQMMRFATGFAMEHIFLTHMHADHFLGLTGLLRTMGLQGRTEPMTVYGPAGSARAIGEAIHVGVERSKFDIEVKELSVDECVGFDGFRIQAFEVRHGVRATGYALVEQDRPGPFDLERARGLGIPEGPLFGELQRGSAVHVDGRVITPDEVVGAPRPGRTVVYTGDTLPGPWTVEVARGANVLIHEATFGSDEVDRARDTKHSTAAQAAEVAREAGVKRLYLTHVSARYSDDPRSLEAEARAVFPGAVVAHDGLSFELEHHDP
jgi:ribonuclease Z